VLLADRYTDGYPELLRVATHPVDAERGVVALESFAASGAPHFALYFDHDGAQREFSTLDIFLPEPPLLLSDLLPVIDGFGIRVIDAQQLRVTRWIAARDGRHAARGRSAPRRTTSTRLQNAGDGSPCCPVPSRAIRSACARRRSGVARD
jgi:hypothetical protein